VEEEEEAEAEAEAEAEVEVVKVDLREVAVAVSEGRTTAAEEETVSDWVALVESYPAAWVAETVSD